VAGLDALYLGLLVAFSVCVVAYLLRRWSVWRRHAQRARLRRDRFKDYVRRSERDDRTGD
jgi:Flp pilus assembly protein TadB